MKSIWTSGVAAVASLLVGAAAGADEIEWEAYADLDRQVFPSLVVATATVKADPDEEQDEAIIGEQDGRLGALVGGAEAGTKLKLVIKANAFMEESSVQGAVPEEVDACALCPRINWKFDALLKHRQVEPLNIVMELFVDGESEGTKSETLTMRSLNDCPLYAAEVDEDGAVVEDGEGTDLTWMFAAYVNENHLWVDQVTKEALAAGVVEQFDGYQSGDPDQVLNQVFAIWNVLQRRGMKYSDITTQSAESPVVFSQHVRLFDEAIEAAQANCVDGTVLFASILRKIGINPHLVLVPGHCYLAFDLDPEGEQLLGLETTMMGGTNLKKYDGKKISTALREQHKNEDSWQAFCAAIDQGTAQMEEAGDKFEDEQEVRYQIVSVAEARKLGILPLAYKK